MRRDTRKPRVDQDGVRVFESGRGRRPARARILVGVAATVVAIVVAVTASAVLFLRHDSAPPAPPVTVAGDVSAPRVPEQHVAAPVLPAIVRAVPKVAAAHVENAPTPSRRSPTNRRTDRVAANVVADHATVTNRTAPTDRATDRANDTAPDSAAAEQRQRKLESLARDVIDGLRATGETGGLAAFPPPGTVPIKVGLVVPDGYELPPGYMRYYQNTDDGQRLEPILMFSPDYDFVDADGKPVALPKDGVVPPEMAPPGLPQRLLELPKTRTAGPDSRRPGS